MYSDDTGATMKFAILRRLSPAVILAPLALACGDRGTSNYTADLDSIPVLQAQEELRVGNTGEPAVEFRAIGPVAVDAAGNIYVAESADNEIRVFDSTGVFLRRIGGARGGSAGGTKGGSSSANRSAGMTNAVASSTDEGFGSIVSMGIIGDTIWVGDFSRRRLALYTTGGQFLRTIPTPSLTVSLDGGASVQVAGAKYLANGRLLAVMSSVSWGSGASPDSIGVPRLAFNELGAVVDTLGYRQLAGAALISRVEEHAGGQLRIPNRWDLPVRVDGDSSTFVVTSVVAASADANVFTVEMRGLDGGRSWTQRIRYMPRELEALHIDTLVRRIASETRLATPAAATADIEEVIRTKLQAPSFAPPVFGARASHDDGLWLRMSNATPGLTRWLVMKPDGSPVGTVDLPANISIRWMSADVIWAAVSRSNAPPSLVKYRLRAG
jgi:hypothetical protein